MFARRMVVLLAVAYAVFAGPVHAQPSPSCPRSAGGASITELASCYDALQQRVVKLEAKLDSILAGGSRSGTAPAGNRVDGDLLVTGRVCVGQPCIEGNERIQVLAQQDAEILLLSNLSGQDPQGGAPHASVIAGNSDGGFRLIQNFRNYAGGLWQEPAKPRTIIAMDSRGTPSISQDRNGIIYPAQNLVINLDDGSKTIRLMSMRQGWRWEFRTSTTGNNTFDGIWAVPTP